MAELPSSTAGSTLKRNWVSRGSIIQYLTYVKSRTPQAGVPDEVGQEPANKQGFVASSNGEAGQKVVETSVPFVLPEQTRLQDTNTATLGWIMMLIYVLLTYLLSCALV